jgi:hypothetical protein
MLNEEVFWTIYKSKLHAIVALNYESVLLEFKYYYGYWSSEISSE